MFCLWILRDVELHCKGRIVHCEPWHIPNPEDVNFLMLLYSSRKEWRVQLNMWIVSRLTSYRGIQVATRKKRNRTLEKEPVYGRNSKFNKEVGNNR